jgi:NADPH2:quinone reductase
MGVYKAPSFPYTLGREASGIVSAVHPFDPHDFKVGDHVVYTGEAAYATYTAIAASSVVHVPTAISLEDAAAAPIQGWTAWTLLHESHPVKEGDWILITAAAGGVGQWLVRMAKFLGAKVIGTCSTKKMDLVKGLGADHVIDYSAGSYKEKVLKITGGEGVVAVFDSVGKTTFDESLECVARKGSMVSFGNASGVVEPLSIL